MAAAIHAQCVRLARIAEPDDSYRRLAVKVADELSERQVQRRIEAMERDLGLAPAERTELGGGRRRGDGSEPHHSRAYRRAGTIARQWRRFKAQDCL